MQTSELWDECLYITHDAETFISLSSIKQTIKKIFNHLQYGAKSKSFTLILQHCVKYNQVACLKARTETSKKEHRKFSVIKNHSPQSISKYVYESELKGKEFNSRLDFYELFRPSMGDLLYAFWLYTIYEKKKKITLMGRSQRLQSHIQTYIIMGTMKLKKKQ